VEIITAVLSAIIEMQHKIHISYKIVYSQLCFEDLESIAIVLRQDPQLQEAFSCEKSDDEETNFR